VPGVGAFDGLEREDGSHAPMRDVLREALEPLAPVGARAALTEVVVDDVDSAPGSSASRTPCTSARAAWSSASSATYSRAVFERKVWPILGTALGLFFFFGGALRGLFPGLPGISWESHIFGFLGGVLAARIASAPALRERAKAEVPVTKKRIAVEPAPQRLARVEVKADAAVEDDLAALRRRMGR
jgi:hypothetical protein